MLCSVALNGTKHDETLVIFTFESFTKQNNAVSLKHNAQKMINVTVKIV